MPRTTRWVGAVAAALLSSMGLVPALAGVAGAAQPAPTVAHPPTSTTKVTTDQRITTTRVAGANRFLTAVAISQRAYPDGLAPTHGTVYLARADVYADALAAGTLANGPILLVPKCGTVPQQVIDEVIRLQPDRIAVLGDVTAVCDQVLNDVAGVVPSARYGGSDRYATAIAIADFRATQGPVTEVYVASGKDASPDAVAGGVLTKGPILTADANSPRSITDAAAWVAAHPGITRVVALGGADVVPQSIVDTVAGGIATDRLSGPDRFATAAAIGTYEFHGASDVVYLARGDVYVDAIAAGSLTDGPVYLVPSTCALPESVRLAISSQRPSVIVALGGPDVVCDGVLPLAVAAASFAQISVGAFHSCGLTGGGSIFCWGQNGDGQVGDGTQTNQPIPIYVEGLPGKMAEVAAGYSHTCARTAAGAAYCWGYNVHGELGDGTTTDSTAPVAVVGMGSGVTRIVAGGFTSCAIQTGGQLSCWGNNVHGQIGNGSTANQSTPAPVSGLGSGVTQASAGGNHTCAVAGGSAYCWGMNTSGAIGDGTTTDRLAPTKIASLGSIVSQVSAGYDHSCAVLGSALRCWGGNSSGQLGMGNTTDLSSPAGVPGLGSGVSQVSAGDRYTCATVAGAARCWGSNQQGQLGDNTVTDHLSPAAVTGLTSGVSQVLSDGVHTCAQADIVYCWGQNTSGELGDGTLTQRLVPTPVA